MDEPAIDCTFIIRLTTSDPEGWKQSLLELLDGCGTLEDASDETGLQPQEG